MKPIVSVIIPTYNRPDVLKIAINSVVHQTNPDWILYVIGDNCDDRTSKVVQEFEDERIKYINLTDRFGEQSGPNSIGIAIAETKYLAFLNHDDIWLKDHLELGVALLDETQYDFYLGGIANSAFFERNEADLKIYVDHLSSKKRKPVDFFKQKILSYEPASSWIMEVSFAKKIGYWKYYDEIFRVPIEDYILRAWREGAKFYFSDKISVWYILTHHQNQKNANSYDYQSNEHTVINNLLSTKTSDDIRVFLNERYLEWKELDGTKKEMLIGQTSFGKNKQKTYTLRDRFYLLRKSLLNELVFSSLSAYLYKYLGLDMYHAISILKKKQKGEYMNSAILKRTGVRPQKPDKEMVIKRVLDELNR